MQEVMVLTRALLCLVLELHPDQSNVQPGCSTAEADVGSLGLLHTQQLVGPEAIGGQKLQTLLSQAPLVPRGRGVPEPSQEGGFWEDGVAVGIQWHPTPLLQPLHWLPRAPSHPLLAL
eukprot:3808985-Rhodomonas_salina.5